MNKEKRSRVYELLAMMITSLFMSTTIFIIVLINTVVQSFPIDTSTPVYKHAVIKEEVVDMIKRIAKEEQFDEKVAIRIATCESQLGKYKYNLEGSSATGLFQFMPSTFKRFCFGDINNNEDQIRCFMSLYPKYAGMWECK